jgi:hypothetical protein
MKLFYYIRRFWEIPGVEKLLIISIIIIYTLINLAIQILRIKLVLKLVTLTCSKSSVCNFDKSYQFNILKTFRRIGRIMPRFNNCLIKVITAKFLLNFYRIKSQIILGINMEDGYLNGAHASLCLDDNTRFFNDSRFIDAFKI